MKTGDCGRYQLIVFMDDGRFALRTFRPETKRTETYRLDKLGVGQTKRPG